MEIKTLCVYCGSNPGDLPVFMETAHSFGAMLAGEGIRLVYGGGRTGLMGAVADGALSKGGNVVGIIPRALITKEVAHEGLTELRAVDSMHERKQEMAGLADAFVAMPGGIGTLEEIAEVFTWNQLGLQAKPCGLLNVAGFYDGLHAVFDRMVSERFLMAEHLATLLIDADPAALLARLRAAKPVTIDKWYDRSPAKPNPAE